MAGKRGNGEGTIFKLPSGKWRAVITAGFLANGKRKRITRTRPKRSEAFGALNEMLSKARAGRLNPTTGTVGEHLDVWLRQVAVDAAPSTHESYRATVAKHIAPRLGKIRLAELSRINVNWMLEEMALNRVGARTRQYAYVVLRVGLEDAVKSGLIQDNPCAKVNRPKATREEIGPLSRYEATRLLAERRRDRDHAVYVLALTLGLRQGELFGMHSDAVNFQAGTVLINRQVVFPRGVMYRTAPKTKSSRRTLQLPVPAIAALTSHRAKLIDEGLDGCEIVFPGGKGGYQRRENFRSRVWAPTLKRLRIEYRGFHHLRHTYATLALGAGAPIHVISQILGHSNGATTPGSVRTCPDVAADRSHGDRLPALCIG